MSKHDPHVVLTDVVMPGMAGPELAERLRSLRPNLPIVFLSGHVDRSDSRLPKDALLLTKPCSPRALASMLARALTTASSV